MISIKLEEIIIYNSGVEIAVGDPILEKPVILHNIFREKAYSISMHNSFGPIEVPFTGHF